MEKAKAKLKEAMPFPTFIFSPVYIKILKLLFAERRLRQIAQTLEMSEQNLNYYINRLIKAGIIERGIRTSYREIYIKESIKERLKEKISEFETKKVALVCANAHHISVVWPIIYDAGVKLKHKRKRWKSELTEELVIHHSHIFGVEKTSKNLIVRFPTHTGINFTGLQGHSALKAINYCSLQIAEPIKNKLLKRFKGKLKLGTPKVHAHYCFKDKVAHKATRLGITFVIKRGNKWISMDKSPHFSPKGEVETSNAEIAQNYLEMILSWPKIKKLLSEY